MSADRRAELGRLFDQGLHGHAAGDREAWIEERLGATVDAPGAGGVLAASGASPAPVPTRAEFAQAHMLVGNPRTDTFSCSCRRWPLEDVPIDHLELADVRAGYDRTAQALASALPYLDLPARMEDLAVEWATRDHGITSWARAAAELHAAITKTTEEPDHG